MNYTEWSGVGFERSASQLVGFMTPVLAEFSLKAQRVAASRYVQGLLMLGERKSIVPMAGRLRVDPQCLQQFISDSPWCERAVWRVLRQHIVPHLQSIKSWIVDESGCVKQGQHSVGVSHQYGGSVGKQANCQVSVELAVSDGAMASPIGGRLY